MTSSESFRRMICAALFLAVGLLAAGCTDDDSADNGVTAADASTAGDATAPDAGGGSDAATPDLPAVEGPVTGPGDMFIDPLEITGEVKAADLGYAFDEYIVSGTAAGEPYAVRLMLALPAEGSGVSFSGHVLLEPKHGTTIPFLWHFTREYLTPRGHAAAEVSLFPSTLTRMQDSNPERYADLRITEEQQSDVLAQVGLLLKSEQTPLEGVQYLYMTGHSMAVGPVWHYMDTHHNQQRLPEGGPIYDGFFPETTRTASRMGPFPDVDVPTLLINSELEVEVVLVQDQINYRKPDSDEPGEQFRLYEIAGMMHNPAWMHPLLLGLGIEESCDQQLNRFPYNPVISMALDHLIRWVGDGVAPPHADRIELEGTEDNPTAVKRDEHGNALGGVRTTTLEVPTATHQALNTGTGIPGLGDCLVFGSQLDFPLEKLQSLYGNQSGYQEQVEQRLDKLIEEGWFLEEFAAEIRSEAAAFDGFSANGG